MKELNDKERRAVDLAHALAMGYAWGRQDEARQHNTDEATAFAGYYADLKRAFLAERLGMLDNVQRAYDHWAVFRSERFTWEPGDLKWNPPPGHQVIRDAEQAVAAESLRVRHGKEVAE
jgi:hypothetical protein